MKAAILIPAHCSPKVLKLTLGSWLAHYDGSYDVRAYIGLHSNYSHSHVGLSEIMDMASDKVKICFVDEIDWGAAGRIGDMWGHVSRYSRMHCVNMSNLIREANVFDPDYVAIFDHDLVFHKDFVKWAIESYPDADLVGSLMNDRTETRHFDDAGRWAPKFSIWHLLMSRRMFQKIVEDVQVIFPFGNTESGTVKYDSFARAYELAKGPWKMNVKALKESEISLAVRHIWSMSLNFGHVGTDGKGYQKKVADVEAEYDVMFPNGITHLLEKL